MLEFAVHDRRNKDRLEQLRQKVKLPDFNQISDGSRISDDYEHQKPSRCKASTSRSISSTVRSS